MKRKVESHGHQMDIEEAIELKQDIILKLFVTREKIKALQESMEELKEELRRLDPNDPRLKRWMASD